MAFSEPWFHVCSLRAAVFLFDYVTVFVYLCARWFVERVFLCVRIFVHVCLWSFAQENAHVRSLFMHVRLSISLSIQIREFIHKLSSKCMCLYVSMYCIKI